MIKETILGNEFENSGMSDILNKTDGLNNLGGDMNMYRQVINEYYHENKSTLYKLLLAIDEKRYTDASQIVHKVKSSTGSIGAKSVYEISIKLQKALDEKNEEMIKLLHNDFSRTFRKLLEEISNFED